MRLRFGRYAGMTTEALILRRPDYVVWMLREAPDGVVGRDFTSLIQRFDDQVRRGADGGTCLAAPNQTDVVVADAAKAERLAACSLGRIDGFWDAVAHVERTSVRGRRQALRRLVRNLALARGMPGRFTDRAALVFLGARGAQAIPDRHQTQRISGAAGACPAGPEKASRCPLGAP